MATVDNERYLRHILLLGEGGLLVLRGIVTREAASRGRTLQNILSCERPNLRTLFREQYSCLFPSSSTVNADVESWDMSLLMVVVKKLFFTTLTQAERTSINTLRTYRVDVQGHPTEMFMGAAEYVTSRADVVAVLRQLSSGINQSSIDEIESIINRTESGNIDILSAMQHIKELHEFKRSLLIELENKFDDTFAKISELDNKLSVIEGVVSKPVQLNDEDSESLRNIQSVQSHLHEDLLDVKSMTNRIDDSSSETHSDMALVKEKLNTLERNDEGRHEELTTHLRRINVNSDESKQAINEIKDVVSKPVQLNDEDCESLRNIQSVQSHLHEDLLDVKCMTDRIDDASSVTHSDVALIKEKLNTLERNDEDRHEELTTHLRRINMNSDESKQAINEIKDLAARPKDLSEADRNTMKGQELRISIIVQNMNAMKQMLMYQIKRGASKELQTIIEA
ncbi:uncharacterized protein LOC128553411, partial [Mercenaria mercenaria]|uniref:uncharacterized protein LOC128553411 n=1 Tax=Mercenaria mercenaria TaxID=6596 RepID=UPI00234EF375